MQEERGRSTWEAPDVPVVDNDGVWSTAPEARKGKPGHRTMLEPTHGGSTRDRQVEESCDRESPPNACGESYRASYSEVGKAHHRGKVSTEARSPARTRI